MAVGLFIGAIVTSCAFCFCNKPHHPEFNDSQVRIQERSNYSMPKRNNRIAKRKYRAHSKDSNQTIEDNSTKSE